MRDQHDGAVGGSHVAGGGILIVALVGVVASLLTEMVREGANDPFSGAGLLGSFLLAAVGGAVYAQGSAEWQALEHGSSPPPGHPERLDLP